MPSTVGHWDVLFALPNLRLFLRDPRYDDPANPLSPDLQRVGLTLGSPDIAIVPAADLRVKAAVAAMAGVRALVEGFRDEDGRPVAPALLIVRSNAEIVECMEALTAFRNALALTIILRARTEAVAGGQTGGQRWSDLFDFYPATITRDGELVLRSPAVVEIADNRTSLNATPAPHVWSGDRRLMADTFLLRTLGAEWRRRYYRPRKDDAYGRTLFRSIELAFAAAAVPMRNAGSIFDQGTHLALWVSALEVLAWPGRKHADRETVRDLLRTMPWPSDMQWVRQRRYTITERGRKAKRLRVTPAEKVTALLYKARNDFLHGNPVGVKTLFPWGRTMARRGLTLPNAAGVIYRLALTAYLGQHFKHGPEADHHHSFNDYLDAGSSYRALSTILRGTNPEDEFD